MISNRTNAQKGIRADDQNRLEVRLKGVMISGRRFHFALMSPARQRGGLRTGAILAISSRILCSVGEGGDRSPIADTAHDVTIMVTFRAHIITERADNLPDTQPLLFTQSCKFAVPARISLQAKMLPDQISTICTRHLGPIDNVALKRWALFTVE